MVPEKILISCTYPNNCRLYIWFPVIFRYRAVQSRGNIIFSNTVQIKTVGKQNTPTKFFLRLQRALGEPNGVGT